MPVKYSALVAARAIITASMKAHALDELFGAWGDGWPAEDPMYDSLSGLCLGRLGRPNLDALVAVAAEP